MPHAFICDAVRTPFGRYGGSLAPVHTDEHARPDTTLEVLAALKPIVRPDGTAASENVAAKFGLTPKARTVATAAAGVAPRVMGLGPVEAAHVNPKGGAIALGHPLGASGARLSGAAVRQLERIGGRYAPCTMCIGVGQGIATLLERV